MGPTREHLIPIVEPAVNAAGYDLVQLEFGRNGRRWILRLYIDLLPGESGGVTHQDCERVSRVVSASLDVADPIPMKYALEVSSPGLDRPLRRECDFRRFLGQRARISLTDAVDGRRRFSGVLRGVDPDTVTLQVEDQELTLPLEAIAKANLVSDF